MEYPPQYHAQQFQQYPHNSPSPRSASLHFTSPQGLPVELRSMTQPPPYGGSHTPTPVPDLSYWDWHDQPVGRYDSDQTGVYVHSASAPSPRPPSGYSETPYTKETNSPVYYSHTATYPVMPKEFAELFPSAKRLTIRHDDSSLDGNLTIQHAKLMHRLRRSQLAKNSYRYPLLRPTDNGEKRPIRKKEPPNGARWTSSGYQIPPRPVSPKQDPPKYWDTDTPEAPMFPPVVPLSFDQGEIPQSFKKLALSERFGRASRAAYRKLESYASRKRTSQLSSSLPSRELSSFVSSLGTEKSVVDRGFESLNSLLNHEVFSSLSDVYSFLHVAYAMSQTEKNAPCRTTPAEFNTGLEALRNCLDDKYIVDDSGSLVSLYTEKDIFDEIVKVMWEEIDEAVGWLGKQEGLNFLEAMKRTARELQRSKDLLRQRQRENVGVIVLDDVGVRDRTERSKWLEIVTGSIFGIAVGFLQAARGAWDSLLETFSTAAHSFLLDPLEDASDELLNFFATFFDNVYNVSEPIISSTCPIEVFTSALELLREGAISTLRGFENYLLWVGKVASSSQGEFLAFVEAVVRQSCTCAQLAPERPKSRLSPAWAEDYSLCYAFERFSKAAETYQPISASPSPSPVVADEQQPSPESDDITPMDTSPDSLPAAIETPITSEEEMPIAATPPPPPTRSAKPEEEIKCRYQYCNRTFSTRPNLYRHQRVAHPEEAGGQGTEYVCGYNGCNKILRRKDNVHKHRRIVHGITEKLAVMRA